MEYHLSQQTLLQPRDVLNTVAEQAVDIDLTLPDYCPDIERILCCRLIPKLYLANVSGDRLSIEGSACVRVQYTDSKGRLRAYEYSRPFSDSLPLRETCADCAVSVQAKPEYINCRALSPRKLSLHGAFSLYARVTVSSSLTCCSCDDDALEVKSEKVSVTALTGLCSECFSVQENIPLGAVGGTPSLLSHRLDARLTELKAVSGKIMLSAELRLELTVTSGAEGESVECLSYSLPVSKVIDCEGAKEDALIDGELTVMSREVTLGGDALDGSAQLSLDAKLCFCALCMQEQELALMTDAFSVDQPIVIQSEPFSCDSGTVCRSYTDIAKANVSVDDAAARVIDVHCEKLTVSPTVADGTVLLTAKLCAGILYENREGERRYVERDAEFVYRPDTEGLDTVLRLRASVDSLSYRLIDDRTLALRAELCYRLTLCRRLSRPVIASVTADEDAPAVVRDGALILYYTDGSDSVWDIAKRFGSRPAEIAAENGIEGDCVDSGMLLLIPTA